MPSRITAEDTTLRGTKMSSAKEANGNDPNFKQQDTNPGQSFKMI